MSSENLLNKIIYKMKSFFSKICVFVKRDFLIETSYKLAFGLAWMNIFVLAIMFYYISKLFHGMKSVSLEEYGGEYFPFVFIGLALSGYLKTALLTFSRKIRTEQMMGTLEAMITTPTSILTIITALPIWSFIFNAVPVIIYFLFGIYFFGITTINSNYAGMFIIIILTMISSASIGIISASFIIVFKNGDPLAWAISLFSDFFAGAFFPISLLPAGLRSISKLLPMTYTLKYLRGAFLQGYTFNMLLPYITILTVFSAVLFPLSILIFIYSIHRAKITGSLSHY